MRLKEKRAWPLWLKWMCCAIPFILAVILYLVLPHTPRFTEYVFARGIFRAIAYPLNLLISVFPFSVTEMIVILAAPLILTLLIIFVYRIIKRADRAQVAEKGARFVCWCLSLAALIYMIMHGGNYNRLPVGELFALNDNQYDAAFLTAVTADLAKKSSTARLQVAEDENGCMQLSVSMSETLKNTDDCYQNLRETYPFITSGTKRVKSVLLSHYWSYTGITGVYCPWLGESNVNTDVPHSGIPHTAAHEVAHTMGFSREDACNFIAFLGCITSDDPNYVYSGYLSAFIYCSNALYAYDTELWAETVSHCSDGVLRDLRQRNAYWKDFQGEVMEASDDFNDAFIKANGVESGVLNYNEVVSLILRYYDTHAMV